LHHTVLRYKEACIIGEYSPEYFHVKARNYELEVRPRMISLTGCGDVSVSTLHRGRKRAVYVSHQVIECFRKEECKGDVESEVNTGYFTVKATATPHGDYITILTPGSFLSDYIVIGEDMTYIQLPGGRDVYFEKLTGLCTIYIV